MSSAADPLIEALMNPACYDEPVERVERVETHISWVLLTGAFAYKIKKPLRLPFLDFSSLELRRHFCEEELRLNRRLAPALYLDVVPIGGTREAPRIGAAPAIEYAVKMRQFPAEARLDRALASGSVSAQQLEQLAERLAAFHQALPAATAALDPGSGKAVTRTALDNVNELAALTKDPEKRAVVALLAVWLERRAAALGPCMDERKASGRVREGHGDLHLENVVVLDGELLPFDALEFDPALRWTDVIDEAAFLAMDLMAHERPDLAFQFLNRYLETSGDYGGLMVLRFYLVHRALVRAKVRLIKAAQERTLHLATHGPRPYLRLARALVESTDPPALIITHGYSGSGKTHLTQRLLAPLRAIRIRSDLERKRIHGVAADAASGSGIASGLYAEDASKRTYERLARVARDGLRGGFRIIVDAAFLQRAERDRFRSLAAEEGAAFVMLDCNAPDDVLRERIRRRQTRRSDASEADEAVLEHQLRSAEPLAPQECSYTVQVDTLEPGTPESLAARLERTAARSANA